MFTFTEHHYRPCFSATLMGQLHFDCRSSVLAELTLMIRSSNLLHRDMLQRKIVMVTHYSLE